MQELEKIFSEMKEIWKKYYGKISEKEILEKFNLELWK